MITPSLKTALRNFRKYLLELHFRNLAISNPVFRFTVPKDLNKRSEKMYI